MEDPEFGLAIAEKFVSNKIFTIVIGRSEEKLKATRERLGDLCAVISFDLTDLSGIPALIDKIYSDHGNVDILVNNAGINMKKEFTEVTDEDFQRIMLTNVNSIFSLSREVVKRMLQKGKGSIINISSMASQIRNT